MRPENPKETQGGVLQREAANSGRGSRIWAEEAISLIPKASGLDKAVAHRPETQERRPGPTFLRCQRAKNGPSRAWPVSSRVLQQSDRRTNRGRHGEP